MALVGIDIGGTNITAAAVDEAEGRAGDREKIATPTDGPASVGAAVLELLEGLGGDIDAVGVGVPGPVRDGVVAAAPNLSGWGRDVELGRLLEDVLGGPVHVGNDASLGTYGEWRAGAARDADGVLGVWLGTGVGGGIVLDGRLVEGAGGGAGELGHVQVDPGGAVCGCGRRGCVEAYAGRASMARAVELAVAAGRSTALVDVRDEKGKSRFTSGVWSAALDAGDALAHELWSRALDALAAGVASALNLLDVDVVVLGGGMAEKLGDDLAEDLWARTVPLVLARRDEQRMVVGTLGDDAGIVGAALWAGAQAS